MCIKQVPDTDKIKIDENTNTLIRDGVDSIVNPLDMYALEAAARIRDEYPDTKIVVASMGVMSAEKALRECLAVAADKAYLINDKSFGGSDTFATAYILYNAICVIEKSEGRFDAIFCGRQAIDGDTGQVGGELAENLKYHQMTNVLTAKLLSDDDFRKLRVIQERDNGKIIAEVKCPCLITFTKSDMSIRSVSLKSKLVARKKEISVIKKDTMTELNTKYIGLLGSPTRVKKTYTPRKRKNTTVIDAKDAKQATHKLIEMLMQEK